MPARRAARAQCGRHAARRQCGRRAHPGPGESRNRRRPARRRRRRFPSAARRIHGDLAPLGGCRFVAIGRSTAAEAESLGLTVSAVAEEPTASGLVAAVVRSLASRPSAPPQPAAEPTARTPYELPDPPPPPAPHHPGHAPADVNTASRPRNSSCPPSSAKASPSRTPSPRCPACSSTPRTPERAAAEAVELGVGGMLFRHPRRPRRRRHRLTGPRWRVEQGHPRRPRRGRGRPRHHERRLPGRIHRPRALRCPRRPRVRGQRRASRSTAGWPWPRRRPGPTCSARPE